LSVSERFKVRLDPLDVFHLWPEIYGGRWTESMMRNMSGRVLDVLVLDGPNAVATFIEFKDQLRSRSAKHNSYRNLLHSPKTDACFRRELEFLRSVVVGTGV
jgi:hypothetical protein